ncbi:MAG: peptidase M20 [Acidobacteria bacterium]|nr:MAG: peptidase M20 [Acidobacteriota bacterium]
MELAGIPAPPFGEAPRAEWLAAKFKEIVLDDVRIDEIGNVLGVRRGTSSEVIAISAHIDTVFPAGTALDQRSQARKLYGPGISDNAAGVTAMISVASAFQRFRLPHTATLLFIGNVGEEGEGDLRGMRHIFSESAWKDKIVASIVIDGAGTDTIIADALGSRRFEVTLRGPGGHSWTDFGAPNPIVALARAIQLFSETRVPNSPKTTFNVGVISGGTSVNSIPEWASMRVDIRSSSAFEIERLELELRQAVKRAMREEENRAEMSGNYHHEDKELEAVIKVIGNRPAGELDRKSRILQIARAVDAHLGILAQVQRASTDANIPISLGREAIAIGAGGHGGGAHTLQEWFDPKDRELGLERILLLVLALAANGEAGVAR